MKYLYKIGYGGYESSSAIELSHTRKIDKREFNNMFIEATLELLLNRREHNSIKKCSYWYRDYEEGEYHQHNIDEHGEIDFEEKIGRKMDLDEWLEDHCRRQYTRMWECLDEVAEVMVEIYGFKRVKYNQQVYVFGDRGIVDPDDKCEQDSILDRICKKFWSRKFRGRKKK